MSRYGFDFDGKPNGCPPLMYPWDADYPGEVYGSFDEFRNDARHDPLNLPISWFFDCDTGEFELVYVMPRKRGLTWAMKLAPGYDRVAVEQWLEDWTREVAASHYGWRGAS